MARKIICIVVAVLFLINDICFGLGVMPGSTQHGTKDAMYAAAQKLLAVGRGETGAIDFDESNIPRIFEGGRGLLDPKSGVEYIGYGSKYQTSPVPVDYENPPTGWKNNPILKETNLIKAFEIFRDTEARISADILEIEEGWFPVDEDAGELPIARIERMGEGRYVLIIHTKFVKMWNHIRENDVWFELYMGEYDRRTVSAAWGIFYRVAKHEMAELSKRGDTLKSTGHISYNPESLPQDDETLANEIGGNYALVNDAIWLWFLGSYCFADTTRHDNNTFLKRIDWFFNSEEARALKLHLEFPDLIKDPSKRMLARAFAFMINHDFFNRPNIRGPIDFSSPVNPEFIKKYKDREALRKDANITQAPMYATGNKEDPGQEVPSTEDLAPISETKKAYTPVELLPGEMQGFFFKRFFNHQLRRLTKGQPDAIEKRFEIARELAKLIQTLDSFEGRYYYLTKHWRASDGKPFSRQGFDRFNQKRALQILKKSTSIEDALQRIGIAQLIAQDIKPQIESNKVYRLPKIGSPHERIDDILVKVDLLPLIGKALPAYMGGLKFEAIVKGLVFAYMDALGRGVDLAEGGSFNRIYIPQIDIEPIEPAQDKPVASQHGKQAIEEQQQPAASAGKNSLVIVKKQLPTPYLEISDAEGVSSGDQDIRLFANPKDIKEIYFSGVATTLTEETKQIRELFQNHPQPERLAVINSRNELITYDNIQGKGPLIIGGNPAYTGDSGIEEHPLIKDILAYIVNVGPDKGPGAVELSSDAEENIYKTINLLKDSHIEIFVPQSFKLTENMKKALKDIGKREGRNHVQCYEYTNDLHLLGLLQRTLPPGVKRIVLSADKEGALQLKRHAVNHLKDFRFIRLLSVTLPSDYQKMKSEVKTVYQAKMMTMAILARLFENDKTPMVEKLLKGMLMECLKVDDDVFTAFMNELGMSDEDISKLAREQVILRIARLLGAPIKLVEKIGHELYLMKAFWTAA